MLIKLYKKVTVEKNENNLDKKDKMQKKEKIKIIAQVILASSSQTRITMLKSFLIILKSKNIM